MSENEVISRRRALAVTLAVTTGGASRLWHPLESEAGKKDKVKEKDGKKKRKNKKKKQDSGSSGDGQKVVNEAKKHKGEKYKWGGASPKGFDCSGFTWYVYDKAVNIEIGRTVKEQYKKGKSVSNGSWKPGDIVFFKNTYEHGLSHDGIYIGGGKFIHAENEKTGVVISDLESGYYEDHYAGARRLV